LLDCENNQAPAKRIDIVLLEPYGGSRNSVHRLGNTAGPYICETGEHDALDRPKLLNRARLQI
jgi:hypothetical protein